MRPLDTTHDTLPTPGSPRFWRALDELVQDPGRRAEVGAAIASLAGMEPALGRRDFLRLLGASLAFAGLAGCSGPPPERIVPQLGRGGRSVPSSARYATALVAAGDVVGVIVELRDGRPIRVDGNPGHPSSLGGSDARLQAAILDLWDPARSSAPRHDDIPSSWAAFEGEAAAMRARFATGGEGLRIVSGALHSPTLARQRDALLARYPQARWHVHEPAMGRPADRLYDLSKASVVVTLDADLLGTSPRHLRHARDFAAKRADGQDMSRLYAIEPTPSLTGRNADHAWAASCGDIVVIAQALAVAVGAASAMPSFASSLDAPGQHRVAAIAADLMAHRGASLVAAGPWQPAFVHGLVDAINRALGNDGMTVKAAAADIPPAPGLASLLDDMRNGRVDTLLVLESNPAYTFPGFAEASRHVRNSAHFGRYRDETAVCSHWHLPALHPFETWSDLRASDGSTSIVQPVLAPLVDGRSAHDVIELLLGGVTDEARDRVRQTWTDLSDEQAWTSALREGVFADTRYPVQSSAVPVSMDTQAAVADKQGLDIVFRPDEWSWDGRDAGNAWLQELPRTVTSLTWGNAALVSPALADQYGLADGDVVRIGTTGGQIEVPVLVTPGQATSTVTLTLGHGRRTGLANGIGHDVYPLRGGEDVWRIAGATLVPLRRTETLASTQHHQDMGRRDIVRAGTPAAPPRFPPPSAPASLYPERPRGEYSWGMTIDLNACIGCNACTAACQSENNIPVVGKEEVVRGRRMHWIRVDRYHEGPPAEPRTYHQPVPCMHCEHAPCEVVCPVEATVHDSEGLNLQVYNRCIGTRFCSNNCPYKVRRFNFLQYADFASESLKAMRNPDVTVRQKGVMEKCTYCVQRIEHAHIDADRDGRRIADGEIRTACQTACPTRAIAFGDLGDANSAVSAVNRSERRYHLLEELNTRPRTSYLAALRNPNPGWEDA
jgi:molybdopterin-containing oxidoreductase family iron-sulfur binding subunit